MTTSTMFILSQNNPITAFASWGKIDNTKLETKK